MLHLTLLSAGVDTSKCHCVCVLSGMIDQSVGCVLYLLQSIEQNIFSVVQDTFCTFFQCISLLVMH